MWCVRTYRFPLDVQDTESPTIACPLDDGITVDRGDPRYPPSLVSIARDALLSTVSDNSGYYTFNVLTWDKGFYDYGDHDVSVLVSDLSGNEQICSFTLHVRDLHPPDTVCPSSGHSVHVI